MNDTQGGFLAWMAAETRSVLRHDASSDQDFPIRESDDVGRRGIIEEFDVHLGDRPVAEYGGFDLFQPTQRRAGRPGRRPTGRQGTLHHVPNQPQIEYDFSLPILDHKEMRHKIELPSRAPNVEPLAGCRTVEPQSCRIDRG
jgi:hypothetical protein